MGRLRSGIMWTSKITAPEYILEDLMPAIARPMNKSIEFGEVAQVAESTSKNMIELSSAHLGG